MKELDVLLERFVRRVLDRLDDDELEALECLLERPDQDILEWIASATTSPPPDLRAVVALVRSHALGRPFNSEDFKDGNPGRCRCSRAEAREQGSG